MVTTWIAWRVKFQIIVPNLLVNIPDDEKKQSSIASWWLQARLKNSSQKWESSTNKGEHKSKNETTHPV